MDFQDILFLLIFLIFSFLPKKKKSEVLEEGTDDQIEVVRKKIEALKRKRNNSSLNETSTKVEDLNPNIVLPNKQKEFSAYKRTLPTYEPPVYEAQCITPSPVVSETKNIKPAAKPLREGMKWHIILSKPVCTQSFYGNFTNR